MSRWFRWLWMLSKRLYKRAAFLAIMALIPLAVLALQIAAQAESGFLHIVLAQTDPNDPVSTELVDRFMGESSLIQYTYAADPRAATDMVINGEADVAWIFPDEMGKEMDRFATGRADGVVTVVEREQTVVSRMAREKLNFALQNYTSPVCYLDFVRDKVPELRHLTDEQLMVYYNNVEFNEELFLFKTPDGTTAVEMDNNYLLAPIRGLLGVLMVLCGLAAALFYQQDEQRGTFALVPLRHRSVVAFACLFIAVLNISLVVLPALLLGGVSTFILRELLILLLYAVCCAAFCLLLMRLCGSMRLLAAVLPMLVVLMLVLCPIFFELRLPDWLKLMLPPTYFVNASFNGMFLLYMVVYAAVCVALSLGVEWFIHRVKTLRFAKKK